MAQHPDYPGVSEMKDRHGRIRWRFRRSGHKDVMLPSEPYTGEFNQAYDAITEGRAPPKKVRSAEIVTFEGAAEPRTLKAAYRLLKSNAEEWQKKLDAKTQRHYSNLIENMLRQPVLDEDGKKIGKAIWGNAPVADVRRKDAKALLAAYAGTPHMQRLVLIGFRKLVMVAIEEEWITVDPTYGMKLNPETDGHATWTADQMDAYEERWEIGTVQRTAYALGLWLGNRVSDVARLKWSHLVDKVIMGNGEPLKVTGFEFVQFKGRRKKGGKVVFLPLTPMLERELAPLDRAKEFVVVNPYGGGGYTDGSLSSAMSRWAKKADLPEGCTMHGLRKALGVKLAEADASTRQLMDVLGHSNMAYAELYTREANQVRMSVEAMNKVTRMEQARQRSKLKVVGGLET